PPTMVPEVVIAKELNCCPFTFAEMVPSAALPPPPPSSSLLQENVRTEIEKSNNAIMLSCLKTFIIFDLMISMQILEFAKNKTIRHLPYFKIKADDFSFFTFTL